MWFRRRSFESRIPVTDRLAIPMTPQEVQVLVTALQEKVRLQRIHRPDISGGAGFAGHEAEGILNTAGIAAALGHPVVPLLVNQLGMYGYILSALLEWAPRSEITRQFQVLLSRLHFLAGVARVQRWTVRFDDPGMRWDTIPTTESMSGPLEITD